MYKKLVFMYVNLQKVKNIEWVFMAVVGLLILNSYGDLSYLYFIVFNRIYELNDYMNIIII
jgi:hypothetical protein